MRYRPSPSLVAILLLFGLVLLATGPASPSPASAPPATVATAPSTTESSSPTSPTSGTTTTTETPTQGSPSPTRSCVEGVPVRLRMPSLGVNAPFENIGLDPGAAADASGKQPLGSPKDRTKAGWYASGPAPGSGQGTILTNGHTYRNGSAIFKEDFSKRIAVGQRIFVTLDNGTTCIYAVERVWREVNAKREYPRIVTAEKLYDFEGPERLFLVTCSGSWNAIAQDYESVSMLVATPVN
jgi:hypothetical protein